MIRARLTYANVTATLALVLALGGGVAAAGGLIGPNDIKRNAVRAKHIKSSQVKSAEIAEGAVGSSEIKDESIGINDVDQFQLLTRSGGQTGAPGLFYRAFTFDTSGTQTLDFGIFQIKAVSTANQFQVCNGSFGGTQSFAVWIGSGTGVTRTALSLAQGTCSSNFTVPAEGDFRVHGPFRMAFGTNTGTAGTYYVFGFGGG